MITQLQIDKLRRYLTGQIRTAVENQKGCIGTYYRNKGIPYTQWLQEGGDRDGEIYEGPMTIQVGGNFRNVIQIHLDGNGEPVCTVDGESEEDYELTPAGLTTEDLDEILAWLTRHGFIQTFRPEDVSLTAEFCDFLERHVPDYHTREDVLQQSELQLFIDGHESEITGLTREEAVAQRNGIFFRLFFEAIDAFTRMTPEQKALDERLDRIEADEDKRERFAKLLLEETLTDTEPFGKIAGQVIDAYRNHDCDAMLLAICGWTMKSLVEKTE